MTTIDTRYFKRHEPTLPFGEHYYPWDAPQSLKDYWFRNCEPIEDEL